MFNLICRKNSGIIFSISIFQATAHRSEDSATLIINKIYIGGS